MLVRWGVDTFGCSCVWALVRLGVGALMRLVVGAHWCVVGNVVTWFGKKSEFPLVCLISDL